MSGVVTARSRSFFPGMPPGERFMVCRPAVGPRRRVGGNGVMAWARGGFGCSRCVWSIRAALIDIDGVLTVSWKLNRIPPESLAQFDRAGDLPSVAVASAALPPQRWRWCWFVAACSSGTSASPGAAGKPVKGGTAMVAVISGSQLDYIWPFGSATNYCVLNADVPVAAVPAAVHVRQQRHLHPLCRPQNRELTALIVTPRDTAQLGKSAKVEFGNNPGK